MSMSLSLTGEVELPTYTFKLYSVAHRDMAGGDPYAWAGEYNVYGAVDRTDGGPTIYFGFTLFFQNFEIYLFRDNGLGETIPEGSVPVWGWKQATRFSISTSSSSPRTIGTATIRTELTMWCGWYSQRMRSATPHGRGIYLPPSRR